MVRSAGADANGAADFRPHAVAAPGWEFPGRPVAILLRPVAQDRPCGRQYSMKQSLRLLGVLAVVASSQFGPCQDTKQAPESRTGAVPRGTGGNSWFPVTTLDLGTYYGEGEAVGSFRFKNPTDSAVEWRQLHGSCQCAKSIVRVNGRTYELLGKPQANVLNRVTKVPGQPDQVERVQQIMIEAGAEGEVEVHLDMNQVTGGKSASLDVHTSDPGLPHFKLSFHAAGAQLFTVAPAEVNLNKMTWSESREFTVTVTSALQKDWNILRMEDAKAFKATWEKSVNGDVTSWTIRGVYGPVDGETGGGGLLRFHTDVKGGLSFTVRVLAFVQGPLDVKPGAFVTLGMIRKGNAVKKEIVFEPNDGSQLAATELKFEKTTMSQEFVTATSRQDGNKLVVEISVSDKSPTGLLKGDLVVGLNHPLVKEKRIMFNGFVR